ncbi:putative transcription factor bHLH family [Lupinus albus]|uniref:Putative transcription factor bHLH family n=1 Tax=Lupinus albus TaxID=3870 RepID=A0A6A4PQA9_LUPAL|nr:putative transcription factor bHLH family [Lupinus albus]
MGEDCGTWIPHLQFGWQSPNLSPIGVMKHNGISEPMNPAMNMASRNETMPDYASSALPRLQLGHSNEPHGWFYCLPRFRQGFTPAPNFTAEEKLPTDHVKHFRDDIVSATYGESISPQKQFVVIDQTAGQTTVFYSSRFGSPNTCLSSLHSKLHDANNLNENEPSFRTYLNHMTEPILADKVDENQGTGIESEMHEDTEEINALLYSDSDVYPTEEDDEDDEVTSTGHSPSTMTTHDMHETLKKTAEEVASSAGKTKKRRLSDGYYDDIQLMDTASSLNQQNQSFFMGNDAESRCSGSKGEGSGEMGSLPGSKKMRKEKIRDVLSIVQSIIPGGKDKDPVMLLGDAIQCLKSLKLKAKSLGIDAL